MFQQIFSITRNTFTESIRQPIFMIVTMGTLLLLCINPLLSGYTLDNDNKLLVDLSLSTMLLAGLFLSALTASSVISREIENKTVLSVISKPLSRPAFVIGKYLGVTGAIALAYWIWLVVFLLTVRHRVMSTASDPYDLPVIVFGLGAVFIALFIAIWGNYMYNAVFTSRFNTILAGTLTLAFVLVLMFSKKWEFQSLFYEFSHDGQFRDAQIPIAAFMIFLALLVIAALAVACSTRLGQIPTIVICLIVVFTGIASDSFLSGPANEGNPVAKVVYQGVLPNFQFQWAADALSQDSPITGDYVSMLVLYTICFVIAFLCLGVCLFQTRETG